MSKLPSFQFYPGDWQKDPNLRRCSKAAKGMWIDMLCLAFECEERGKFISNGAPWTDEDISVATGGNAAENLKLLHELLVKGVARRDNRGAIFCARMVRDEQKRIQAVEEGKKGGNPTLKGGVKGGVNPDANPPANPKPTPSSSSSSSSSRSETTPPNPPAGGGSSGQAGNEEGETPETAEARDLYDHVQWNWQAKKKNPLKLRDRDKRELAALIPIYQPWGVKALWDVYLEDKDKFVLDHGHSVRIFFDQIPRLLDNPRYKQMAAQYQSKIGLRLPMLNVIGGKA